MSNNITLSSELHSSKFPNTGYDRTSKVDIKGICQKFENLSGTVGETSVPVPPLRRKRSNQIVSSPSTPPNKSHDVKPAFSNGIKLSTAKNYSVAPSSVKERTKLFESPVLTDELNSPSTKCKKVNRLSEIFLAYQDNSSGRNEPNCKMNVSSPPAKPPRTFLHSDLSAAKTSDEKFEEKKSVINAKDTQSCKSEKTFIFSPNGTETGTPECISKNSKHVKASEIVTGNAEKSVHGTTNISKSTGKTHLKNYLKNISSTANKISEKLKHSSIFVDLTPTTVSPPKRYGTLKKSLSEEHIYAEPISLIKSPNSGESKSPVEPLHYMVIKFYLFITLITKHYNFYLLDALYRRS